MIKVNNIYLVGPMGAGKTSVGKHLARQLSWEFCDTDQTIEKQSGVNISWIFDIEGEDGYRRRETQAIEHLTQERNIILATGGGSVVEDENRKLLSQHGTVIYLRLSIDEQVSRTEKNRDNRPLLQVDDLQKTIEVLMAERDPLYSEIADITIETNNRSVAAVVDDIVEQLQSYP